MKEQEICIEKYNRMLDAKQNFKYKDQKALLWIFVASFQFVGDGIV